MIYRYKIIYIASILFGLSICSFMFINSQDTFGKVLFFIVVCILVFGFFLKTNSYLKIEDTGIFRENKLLNKSEELNWDEIEFLYYDKNIANERIIFVTHDKEKHKKSWFEKLFDNIKKGDFIISNRKNMDKLIYEVAQYIPENTKTNLEFKMKVNEIEYERNKK